MAKTARSDEELVAALVEHGTIRDAAKAARVGERTLYERMKSPEFKNLYNNAKADILRGAVLHINRQLHRAIDCVVAIMENKDTNPATRLQAAQTILNTAGKLQERLCIEDANAMAKPPSRLEQALADFDTLAATFTEKE